jgi:hypothetical protein
VATLQQAREFSGPAGGFLFDDGALHDLTRSPLPAGPVADDVARFRLNADGQGDVACGWTASAEAASAVLEFEYGMHCFLSSLIKRQFLYPVRQSS